MTESILERHINSVREKVLRSKAVSAETYNQRLRLLRAVVIIPSGAIAALGSLYPAGLLMEAVPFPFSIAVPFGVLGLGFGVGAIAGEGLSIAATKLTTEIRG